MRADANLLAALPMGLPVNLLLSKAWMSLVPGVLVCCAGVALGSPMPKMVPLPQGTTLPVALHQGLNAHHVKVGEAVTARLSQRVPLPGGGYLPEKAELTGNVVAYDGKTLGLLFHELKLGDESEPIEVKLVAAALWLDVEKAEEPLSAPDRSLSNPGDWTTMQIGRDEVYRSGWSGKVYDQYGDPVGNADSHGVYAAPNAAGITRAMGPFSTTSSGLYDLPGIRILSPGGGGKPIVFGLTGSKWQLHGQTALLLEVTAP